MLSRFKWNIVLGSLAILTACALVDGLSQPADAQTTLISFEQAEGFPAPTLVPDMAPGGIRDPLWNYTGIAGGTNTGYPNHPNGAVPDKPLFPTNAGAVANWGVASVHFNPAVTNGNIARQVGSWFIDDGPGGIDLLAGSVPSCTGPDVNNCDPAPVSGDAMGVFGWGMEGGVSYKYAGVMDLDNTQDFQLDSFWYANRGNGPPRLQVEYYDTDDTTLLGVNTFAEGTDMRDDASEPTVATWGDRWIGVAEDFQPKFQQFTPTAQFQGVALGKVIFRSFSDGYRTEAPFFDNLWNGDTPSAPPPTGTGGHGMFFLDDISITAGGSSFNPNGYTRISFEADSSGPIEQIPLCQGCAGGFPDEDGALLGQVFNMSNGVVTSITNNTFALGDLKINHGPGGQGTAAPGLNSSPGQYSDTEPDAPHGYQFLLSQGGGPAGDLAFTIDLEDAPGYSFEGLSYAFRGNGKPRVRVQYFDTNNNFLGENTWATPSDPNHFGLGLGQFDGFRPEFQAITMPDTSLFKGVAVGAIKIISDGPGPSTDFSVDDILLKAGGSAFVEPGDFRISFEANEGFSNTAGDEITGAFPAGVVTSWSSGGVGSDQLQIDEGFADGVGFTNPLSAPDIDPLNGEQFALSKGIGNGEHVITMDLENSATLSLDSFFHYYRGSSPHTLTVEYFDLNEVSLGSDVYNGGVDANDPDDGLMQPGSLPKWEEVVPTAAFLNKALSKVTFTSAHSGGLGADFALDDIVLSIVTFLDGDFDLDGDVDGNDFLVWQRTDGTPGGLTLWQNNYGTGVLAAIGTSAVPEPTSVTLLLLGLAVIGRSTRRPSVH